LPVAPNPSIASYEKLPTARRTAAWLRAAASATTTRLLAAATASAARTAAARTLATTTSAARRSTATTAARTLLGLDSWIGAARSILILCHSLHSFLDATVQVHIAYCIFQTMLINDFFVVT
jgi:hypothetical protein